MISKKIYRITLFPNAPSVCEQIALLAAKSNGSEKPLSLSDFESIIKLKKFEYPRVNDGVNHSLIDDNLLIVDYERDGDINPALTVELVEVFESPE
jgi:hypothetical protein